mmetsp:Transcript_4134/g.10378  ORF Transcript_4134/g.10378 Transcript_4134/m.10378 type:complete len:546 (+) Transcript_4134:571-2208(+)
MAVLPVAVHIHAAATKGGVHAGALLDRLGASQNDEISPGHVGVGRLDRLQEGERISSAGILRPLALRRETHTSAVAAALVVSGTVRGRAFVGKVHEHSGIGRVCRNDILDVGLCSGVIRHRHGHWGKTSLPGLRRGHQIAHAAHRRAHVGGGHPVPHGGKGVLKVSDVSGPLLDVGGEVGVIRQRQVAGEHDHRGALRAVGSLGSPLVEAAGAGANFPLEVQQIGEVLVGPFGGASGPGSLKAAGVSPIVARRVQARAMVLTKRMAAADEGHRLAEIQTHAAEAGLDVERATVDIGLAHRSLRVDVDEAESRLAQRRLARAVDRARRDGLLVVGASERDASHAVDVVDATAAEAQRLAAHELDRSGAGQDDEIAPGQGGVVLVLDGLQEREGLVEVAVVHPGELGGEADTAAVAAAAAVTRAVGAGAVPREADHEGPVVPEVGGPEGLRVGEERLQVLLHRLEASLRHRAAIRRRVYRGCLLQQSPPACSVIHGGPLAERERAAGGRGSQQRQQDSRADDGSGRCRHIHRWREGVAAVAQLTTSF